MLTIRKLGEDGCSETYLHQAADKNGESSVEEASGGN
jgi:hypothetical protein